MNKDQRRRVEHEKARIASDPAHAFTVLERIWDRQSDGEKFTHTYDPREAGKGRGFSPDDTRPANEMYERYEEAGKRWTAMSAIDVVRTQKMMGKYARQFLEATDKAYQESPLNPALAKARAEKRDKPRRKKGGLSESERARILRAVDGLNDLA